MFWHLYVRALLSKIGKWKTCVCERVCVCVLYQWVWWSFIQQGIYYLSKMTMIRRHCHLVVWGVLRHKHKGVCIHTQKYTWTDNHVINNSNMHTKKIFIIYRARNHIYIEHTAAQGFCSSAAERGGKLSWISHNHFCLLETKIHFQSFSTKSKSAPLSLYYTKGAF